ncbi:flavin reductase [Clostridium aminobutyricum]|uniref:Flavin reductase n=1 Tax=Clostridium aminobutyricum TaxID=33953 RepID=A0A939D6W9_CLOAM|nr:flavin reductase [Clostridium aminobutyricum]MBN7772352.1 flavin reductase [Clostridium aminobutyricum]
MDNNAMFKIGYGLYVLSAHQADKDSGCIINTVVQVTSNPNRMMIALNKQNYTHDIIDATKAFNVSVLTTQVPFELFKRFGFQSGRNVNKFEGFEFTERSENGILYINKYTNAAISCDVYSQVDLGTHTMFLADVKDAIVLNNEETVTYSYYQSNIKPKPAETAKKGWRCKICGYIYEGEELPADFICPVCKHGASDFEKIG